MSTGFTPNAIPLLITTDTTMSSASQADFVQATIATAKTLTLYSAKSQYAGYSIGLGQGVAKGVGQGILYVYNLAASAATLTVAPASGETVNGVADGTVTLAPGENVTLWSDGAGWTNFGGGGAVSSAANGQLFSRVVPLTSAQILALSATPVALVPSPGTGKCNIVDNISFKMVTTATGYANGGALEFRYTDGSGTKVTADIASGVVTAGAATSFTNVRGIEASLTGTAAAAIVVTNATAPFITGTGTAVVYVAYHVC